ncbi:MAG: SH3 domain-containing protein [Bacilli bacterium]|jgi:beta-N-acetylglucosaminidase|nr:SH3 domain-containing protein [Bacilli bacterium]
MRPKWQILLIIFLFLFVPISVLADDLEITGSDVAIRSLPGTNGKVLARKSHGATFPLLSENKFSDQGGCPAGWYKVNYDGQEAYVCSTYGRVIKSTITVDPGAVSACEKELASLGFPKEYWPGLCNIKINHPNWVFNPVNTGLDFKTAVEKESACGKNTLQTTNPEYIDNSCTTKTDSGYVHASQKAVAYYMNPINFLDEKNIFMFESNYINTGVSDASYIAIVNSRLANYAKNLPTIATAMNNACKTNNVNQVMLSSRIIQELGTTGLATAGDFKGQLLSCISGAYTTRYGTLLNGKSMDYYYNFFNVGVFDGSNGDAAYRAVYYAANNGWGGTGNQETDLTLAIGGGANFLKTKYMDKGQYTVYTQKFNIHPLNSNNLYVNQYMTNLKGPSSEASIAYSAYKNAGILGSPFIFYIPVYSNINDNIDNSNNGATGDSSDNSSGGVSVESIITSSGLKLNGSNLMGLEVGMTLNDINNKINALGGSLTGADLSVKAGTGMTIKVTNGIETKTYTLIVKGDTSGDGAINALDLLQVQKSILGSYKMSDSQKLSADTSNDGSINALDLLQIQKNILGSYKIEQ